MESREVQEKSLKEILQALMEESSLLCPVHQRLIEFLKERRGNSTHSEFLQRLEETVELMGFESLTKQSLVSHIFMEDSDLEITRITTEILAKTPGGNLDEFRTSVKTTESSSWYKPGGKGRANRVTHDDGGAGETGGSGVPIAIQQLMILLNVGNRVLIAIFLRIKLHSARILRRSFLELEELLKKLELVAEVEWIHQS